MLQDLAFALRGLRNRPGSTALAMLLLGIGTGAAAAMFGIVDAYLLQPLPYPDAEQIVRVSWQPSATSPEPAPDNLGGDSWRRAGSELLQAAAAWDLDVFTLLGGETPELAPGAWVSPDYFEVLGVAPALGRPLVEADRQNADGNVAVISHQLWQRRFGGDAAILGRVFQAYVSDRPNEAEVFTIVGVMPADFWPFLRYSEVLAPLREVEFPSLARLAPGVDRENAAQRLTDLARNQRTNPGSTAGGGDLQGRVVLYSLHERYVAPVRPLLIALSISSALVLLIAAGNVALLLLVLAGRRDLELAVRSVLGAGRDRLARQLVLEGLVIALGAALLGLFIAGAVLQGLESQIEGQLGVAAPGVGGALGLDLGTVLAVTLVCSAVGIGLGLVPALLTRSESLGSRLRAGTGTTDTAGRRRTRSLLVAGEVALSLGLLVAAGLASRSAIHLSRVDLGFEPRGLVTAEIGLRQRSYPDPEDRVRFVDSLLSRWQAGGGEPMALASRSPFGQVRGRSVEAEAMDPTGARLAGIRGVSPEYFEVVGLDLLSGRPFTRSDRAESEPVAMISVELAQTLWPGADPIGQRLRFETPEWHMSDSSPRAPTWWRVVGVVASLRETLVDDEYAEVYVPLTQDPSHWMTFVLRPRSATGTEAAIAPVRELLGDLDPDVPLAGMSAVSSQVEAQSERIRFLAAILTSFSLFAVALGLVGLYGVVAHATLQRRRETAIRLALGSEPAGVVRLFLRQATPTLLLGIGAGLLAAVALARALSSQLHGTGPIDPIVWTLVPALLFGLALVATWWPARRAAKIDPSVTLRGD